MMVTWSHHQTSSDGGDLTQLMMMVMVMVMTVNCSVVVKLTAAAKKKKDVGLFGKKNAGVKLALFAQLSAQMEAQFTKLIVM